MNEKRNDLKAEPPRARAALARLVAAGNGIALSSLAFTVEEHNAIAWLTRRGWAKVARVRIAGQRAYIATDAGRETALEDARRRADSLAAERKPHSRRAYDRKCVGCGANVTQRQPHSQGCREAAKPESQRETRSTAGECPRCGLEGVEQPPPRPDVVYELEQLVERYRRRRRLRPGDLRGLLADPPSQGRELVSLQAGEVRAALRRGLFTVTTETARGYYVTLFGRRPGHGIARIAQSKECVRPRTARRYADALVRSELSRKDGSS